MNVLHSCNGCNYPRKKLFNGTNYGSYWTQICLVSCSISTCFIKGKTSYGRHYHNCTSSVCGEQPSQLSSLMPPHSTSRLQLMPPTQNSSSSTSLVQMRPNTHVSSSVTDVVVILDVNYDDLFCDYNTLTTVNSITNTRTIQQTPMFHGCTITNLNITINHRSRKFYQ